MKKIWVPIVLICYLGVSTGVVVNFHYCMNKLASTELFAIKGKKCGKCGMNMHKAHGCCRDEVKVVKMEDDQKLTPAISYELPPADALFIVPSTFIATSFYNVPVQRHYQNHSPPLLTEQDTYLDNCVFRI
jgi:hypothetical protein